MRGQGPDQFGDGLLALADLGLRLARLLLGLARAGLAAAGGPGKLLLYLLPDGSGVDHEYPPRIFCKLYQAKRSVCQASP